MLKDLTFIKSKDRAEGDTTMFNLHHKADLQEIERFSCALTEANAKLEAISRSMAMIEFTPEGIVLDANVAAGRLHGISHKDLVGRHVADLVMAAGPPLRRYRAAEQLGRPVALSLDHGLLSGEDLEAPSCRCEAGRDKTSAPVMAGM